MAGEENPLSPLGGRPARPPVPVPGASLYLDSTGQRPALPLPPTVLVPPPGVAPGDGTRSLADETGEPGSIGGGANVLGVVAGRYELVSILGEGGMGAVYRCYDRNLKRHAALKMIHKEKRDARRETRFIHEARSMARLQHPGCVQIYDVGVNHDGAPYFVMELVQGKPLIDLIEQHEITPGKAALLLHQVAGALHCAHEIGIVHRDVKPHNIIVSDGSAKLADFGIAKDEEAVTQITLKGHLIGTLAYMPPEQTGREGDTVDRRSDVYALGATLYECLVGSPPFSGQRQVVLGAILHHEPTPPRRINADLPRDLEVIALKCLKKVKAERYQSALELQEDLGRFLAGEPVRARKVSRLERVWARVRRHRKLLVAASVAGVAVAAAFGVFIGAGVARERLAAKQALARGDEHFAKGKFEDAEAAFAEAARGETPYAAEARERVLKARAWKLVREGEEALGRYLVQMKELSELEATIESTSDCDRDPAPFEASEFKRRRAAAFMNVETGSRRLSGLESELSVALQKALDVVVHREVVIRCMNTWSNLYRAKVERNPAAGEELACFLDSLANRFGMPSPLQRGSIEVSTDPPGATVHLFRYRFESKQGVERPVAFSSATTKDIDDSRVPPERLLSPVPLDNSIGPTPIRPLTVPSGEYLVLIEHEGHYTVRYPVLVVREKSQTVRLQLQPLGVCLSPSRFRFIAGGPVRSGTPLRYGPPTGDFLMQENETTFGEWRTFYNEMGKPADLLPLGPVSEALTLMNSKGEIAATRITPGQAERYAAWFTQKFVRAAGWQAGLPRPSEFFRALRGPFSRTFAWGNIFDVSFCGSNGVWTDGSKRDYPADESCFGIRDLTGSIAEITAARTSDRAVVLGGSFIDGSHQLHALSTGTTSVMIPIDGALNYVGFRLVIRRAQ